MRHPAIWLLVRGAPEGLFSLQPRPPRSEEQTRVAADNSGWTRLQSSDVPPNPPSSKIVGEPWPVQWMCSMYPPTFVSCPAGR